MVQFRIDVVIEPTRAVAGTQAIEKGLSRVENVGKQVNATLAKLGLGISLALGIRETLRSVDAYQNLQNRLRQVTQSEADLAATTERLLDISNRSRSALEGTVTVYSRLVQNVERFKFNTEEAFQFVELLNKGLATSGLTGTETTAVMIQLSQALQSGKLAGDEFRTIMEAFPRVAQLVARSLGVPVTEMQRLRTEGKLTTDVLVDAFLNSSQEIEDSFGKALPTISQQFQVFKNELIVTIGEIDKSASSSRLLGRTLEFLGNQAKNARGLVDAFGESLGTGLSEATEEEAKNLNLVGREITSLQRKIKELEELTKPLVINGINIPVSVDPAALKELESLRQRLAALQGQAERATKAAPGLKTGERPAGPKAPTKEDRERAEDLAEFTRRLDLETLALTRAANQRGVFREAIELEFEARKKLGTLSEEEGRRLLEQAAQNRILQERATILEELGGAERDMIIRQAALNQLFVEGKISLEEYNKLLIENRLRGLEASTDLGDGFERAFLKMELEAKNFAAVAEEAVNVFADRATDALVTFLTTGELNFKQFTSELLADLAKIAARMAVVAALSALLGPAGGALGGTLFGSIQGRQHGGPVQRDRPYLVGERGPELFTPGQSGQVASTPQTAAALAPPEVNVKVVNQSDPADAVAAMDSPAGEVVVMNILTRNRNKAKRILA